MKGVIYFLQIVDMTYVSERKSSGIQNKNLPPPKNQGAPPIEPLSPLLCFICSLSSSIPLKGEVRV